MMSDNDKIVRFLKKSGITVYFEDCYQEECPYYVPEQKYSNIIKPEHCMKALHSIKEMKNDTFN